MVQTSQHQKSSNGTVCSTTRDASGRIIGTSTSCPSAGGRTTSTTYRDASGRLTGTATTQTSGQGSSRATYRDASDRTAESADTHASGSSGSCSKYCDASGRLIGNVSTRRSPAGFFTGIQRDASGRVTDTNSGKCSGGFPVTSPNLKREHPDAGAGDRFRGGGRIDPFQILLPLRAYRANPRKEKAAKYL
jgi:hypothetical protein